MAHAQDARGPHLSLPRLVLGASFELGLAADSLPAAGPVAQASSAMRGSVDWASYATPEVPRAKLWVARVLTAAGLGLTVGGVAGAWAWGRRGVCTGEHPEPRLHIAARTGGSVAALGVVTALVGMTVLLTVSRDRRRRELRWARDLGILSAASLGGAAVGMAIVSVATLGPWVRCND